MKIGMSLGPYADSGYSARMADCLYSVILIYSGDRVLSTKWSDTMPESTLVVVLQFYENQLVHTSYYPPKRLYSMGAEWV